MTDEKQKREFVEELEVTGQDLVARAKELIEQGNVRRLIVRKKDGEILLEVPLTASVLAGGAVLVFTPMLAALGALAAFFAELKLEVVRQDDGDKPKGDDTPKQKVDIE